MEEYIKKVIKSYDGVYVPIEDEKSLLNIYNFFKNDVISEDEPNAIEALYYGFLYSNKKMKGKSFEYLKLSAEKGCVQAMASLGLYYKNEKKYDLMKKYLLPAIERGESNAMCHIGHYYLNIEKNFDLAYHYYMMAIKNGNSRAMHILAYHYEFIEKNFDLAIKYYKMAIERGHDISIQHLGNCYEGMGKYELAIKYYILAFKNGSSDFLFKYYDNLKAFRNNKYETYDFSFLELYTEKNFPYQLLKIFKGNLILPKKYYFHFSNLDIIFNDSISQCIKNKQFILQKTGVWPSNYNKKYMIQFMELLTIRKSLLSRDLILLIAGYLFI